jgi:hypothetical protein
MSSPIVIDLDASPKRDKPDEPALFGLVVALVRAQAELSTSSTARAELEARSRELRLQLDQSEHDELRFLSQAFQLDAGEFDVLLTCLAFALDPSLAELFARLAGHPRLGFPTEPIIARLFGWGRRRLLGNGNLVTWGLVVVHPTEPGHPAPLSLEPELLGWLQGGPLNEGELRGCATRIKPLDPPTSWPIATMRQRLEQGLEFGLRTRFLLVGPPGSGRRTLAANLAASIGMNCLAIDCDEIADEHWHDRYVHVLRTGMLANSLVVWHGQRVERRWPRHVPPAFAQFVACEDPHAVQSIPGVTDEIIELPTLGVDERRAMWIRLLPDCGWSAAELDKLAARHRLGIGDIARVARHRPVDAVAAAALAREQTRGRLGELGRLLDCPFGWDDLIVSNKLRDELEDFAFEAAERAAFWEAPNARRLFPRGTGLVGLLTGTPGTGKTMAAQVIAASLDLDLFRIDLATVVSKYIGETAKNLQRIFSRSARMNAVLLFDEADALFAKRTEVRDSHDRYANADTNYLLQLLEDYQGIALLATNKKNNLDPAFTRRIRYVLDFPRPDPAQRRAIWRKVTGELAGPDLLRGLEPSIALLAETVDASGAQIKNALLAALFISKRTRRPLDIDHIVRGLDRELGKEGRALSDRERGRLRRNV